jgi:hypothetical protein
MADTLTIEQFLEIIGWDKNKTAVHNDVYNAVALLNEKINTGGGGSGSGEIVDMGNRDDLGQINMGDRL